MKRTKIDLNEEARERLRNGIEELEQKEKELAVEFKQYVDETKEKIAKMEVLDFLYPDDLEEIVMECKKYRGKHQEINGQINSLKHFLKTGEI